MNERLFVAGLLPAFDAAAKAGDRDGLIALLGQVDLAGQAEHIADSVLSGSGPSILSQRRFTPIRLNRQGREIWFEPWLGRPVPCNWKGWLLIVTNVAAGIAGLWLLSWLLHAKNDDFRPFLILPLVIVMTLVVVERHSP